MADLFDNNNSMDFDGMDDVLDFEEPNEAIDFGDSNDNVDFGAPASNNKGTQVPNNSKGYVLYIIMDRQVDGTLDYFRSYGVNVSKIFYSIKDTRDALLMQIESTRVVVIDTGTGRFANMAARKDLVDMMGISDENNRTTVFYSDSIIKSEVEYTKEVEDKRIEWVKYRTTAHVVAHLLQSMKDTKFIADGEYRPAADVVKTLKYKGFKDSSWVNSKSAPVQINTEEIAKMCDTDMAPYSLLNAYDLYLK